MTSLIDVIFLLLLFFMLSSTFTRFSRVDIASDRASTGAGRQQADILIEPASGAWRINGIETDEANLPQALADYQQKGAKTAMLIVRDGLSSQILVQALQMLKAHNLSVFIAK